MPDSTSPPSDKTHQLLLAMQHPRAVVPPSRLRREAAALISAFVDLIEPVIMRLSPRGKLIAVEVEPDDLSFYQVSGRQTKFLGHGRTLDETALRALNAAKGQEVELRLRPDHVIQSSFKVPAGGLGFIEQIIESRLDRLTPWKPEKILFGVGSAGKPGSDGQFDVPFAATSLEICAVSIGRLEAFGLVPSAIGSAAGPVSSAALVDLFRGRNNIARKRRRKRIAAAAVALLAASIVTSLATAYAGYRSTTRLADLDSRLTAARNALVAGAGSPAERESALALIEQKTPSAAKFFLIDRLADIIPMNTFLDQMDISPAGIRLAGTTSEASALIGLLEAGSLLSDVRFSAPVTRQEDGRDRFDITGAIGAKSEATAQ